MATLTQTITKQPRICKEGGTEGVFLPFSDDEHETDDALRAVLYIFFLGWLFLGVAISSDTFMSGIEKITSQKKRVRHPTDPARMVTVTVWNDTVANLTLMAFGSSTPEILLSIIELVSKDFFTGDLGANTIVGSASFNLFLIIGLCISVIGSHEVRMIKDMTVFGITAFFAIFAYLWLYFVLQIVTPNIVDIWEGVVTFLMFPGLVQICYMADKGMFSSSRDEVVTEKVTYSGMSEDEIAEYAENLRAKFGKELPEDTILKLLEKELRPKKTRATYRQEAVKGMKRGSATSEGNPSSKDSAATNVPHVFWDVPDNHFVCLECAGTVQIPVKCFSSTKTAVLHYETRDGTGKDKTEYVATSGKLEFSPSTNEETQYVSVQIVDDDIVEPDMDFYIDIFPEAGTCEVFGPTLHVTIIDDDFPGVLQFEAEEIKIPHGAQSIEAKVVRRKGGNGELKCKVKTEEGSAKEAVDFDPIEEDDLVFEDQEIEKTITVNLRPTATRVRDKLEFRLSLTDGPFNPDTDGGEDACFLSFVFAAEGEKTDMLLKAKSRLSGTYDRMFAGTTSWGQQFVSACYCGGSKEEQAEASWGEMVLHVFSIPWNLLCACAPPPSYGNGWAVFYAALGIICFQTAIIADVAEMVGCTLDIPDMVTAITLVALGTSLPDTFASRTAALQDEYADSSVTNVTGSNAVNVFVGLGVPWTMGAIYWSIEGVTCEWMQKIATVKSGLQIMKDNPDGGLVHYGEELGYSVMIYTVGALIAIGALLYRRKAVGGEFGGPAGLKYGVSLLFVFLWTTYIALSSWVSIEADNSRPAIKVLGGLPALCIPSMKAAALNTPQ
ncbi:unnamed protein product [Amoebophrya sp. A120]|nr:unnamed protein product [Amoebophrya sp. A120]|eukprot:GSA120T00015672001.1